MPRLHGIVDVYAPREIEQWVNVAYGRVQLVEFKHGATRAARYYKFVSPPTLIWSL